MQGDSVELVRSLGYWSFEDSDDVVGNEIKEF